MPANGTKSTTKTQTQARPEPTAREAAIANVRQTAERSVDVPVGAALTFADRVNEIVGPFRTRESAGKELKSFRTQVTRELNRLERRGSSARRKASTRLRQGRNRARRQLTQRRTAVRRAVKQNRVRVEKTVKENRLRFEDSVKRAQTAVQDLV